MLTLYGIELTASGLALILLVTCVVLSVTYLTRTHNYWARQGVPGPRPLPLFGTYFWQFFVPMQELEEERYAKYGKIYGIYDGTKPGLIVGEPSALEQIMLGTTAQKVFNDRRAVKTTHDIMANFLSSLEGEEWKRVRQLIAPTFSDVKLRSLLPIMRGCADRMLATLSTVASKSDPSVDLKDLFGHYTMDVIARTAFGAEPDQQFVEQASALFTFPFWRKFLDYVVPMWILDPLGFTVLPKDAMEFFRHVALKQIRYRRESGERRKDFLQLLLDASNNESSKRTCLSEKEILAQVVLFYSVGYETASQLLMYCVYCLALNAVHQDHVVEEIRHVLTDCGVDCDADTVEVDSSAIKKMIYLNAVIDETLRLYNPVLRMERRASKDFSLEGVTITKGMLVGVPVWAMHHCEEYFPNPHEFQPARFLPENKANLIKMSYLPFGAGPRDCIGKRFSLLETRLALVKVLLKFRFFPTTKTQQPLQFVPNGRPLLGPTQIVVGVAQRQAATC